MSSLFVITESGGTNQGGAVLHVQRGDTCPGKRSTRCYKDLAEDLYLSCNNLIEADILWMLNVSLWL